MLRILSAATIAFVAAAGLAAQQGIPATSRGTNTFQATQILKLADVIIKSRLLNPRQELRLPPKPADPRNLAAASPEVRALSSSINSPDLAVRRAALVVVGRVGVPRDLLPVVIPALADISPLVRTEAANTIAMVVLQHPKDDNVDEAIAVSVQALVERVPLEGDGATAAMMLDALGEIADSATAKSAERLLRQEAMLKIPTPTNFATRQEGAVQGLEAMTRHMPGLSLDLTTREVLRKLTVPGLGFVLERGPVLEALETLVHVRDNDVPTIVAAAQFRCDQSSRTNLLPTALRADCGWEFRRLGFQLMDDTRQQYLPALRNGLNDPSFRVRMEVLRVYARDIPHSFTCVPLFDGLTDRDSFVVVEAIKLLDVKCEAERDAIIERLRSIADDLGDVDKATRWQAPAAAMEALVRFAPAEARRIATETAAASKTWYVRAAAARVAGAVADEDLAMLLSKDDAPNVRTEALYALIRMRSAKVASVAEAALESRDYQLVLTAAAALAKADLATPLPAVNKALVRLTTIGDDTSREARLALLARVQESQTTDKDVLDTLTKLLEDYDPVVKWAAADVLSALTGTTVVPKPPHDQPVSTISDNAPPGSGCFEVALENGQSFVMQFRMNEVAALARNHFYDGLTFHRVIPDAFVEAGSPAANFYTGAETRTNLTFGPERFIIDNLSSTQQNRGTMVLSRHDLHTGSTQFSIELVHSPHLRRQFTVIGNVGPCRPSDPPFDVMMDVVDHLMEGAKIVSMVERVP